MITRRKLIGYAIIAVLYDRTDTYITHVDVRGDDGAELGEAHRKSKEWVVQRLLRGQCFTTAVKDKFGGYELGDEVHPVFLDGEYYIRTDGNRRKRDNLGNLPRIYLRR